MPTIRRRAAALLVLPLIVAGCGSDTRSTGRPSLGGSSGSSTILADDFVVTIPVGWRRATNAELEGVDSQFQVQALLLGARSGGYTANVYISAGAIPTGTTFEEYVQNQVASLSLSSRYSDVSDPVPRLFGGEDGVEITGRLAAQGITVLQRLDIAQHHGEAYFVVFSVVGDAYDSQQPAASAILDSLRFT